MARIKLEEGSGIAGISGRIGNLVFRTMADGHTYAQQAPATTKRPGSAAQQQWRRGTFRAAVAYGKTQQASAEGRAYYQPYVQPGRFASVYSMALADYSKPPQIVAVEVGNYQEQAGVRIRVRAHDPFGVVAAWVQILDATGQVLEEGGAERAGDDWWHYFTKHTHSTGTARQVKGLASDRPGNIAEQVISLE